MTRFEPSVFRHHRGTANPHVQTVVGRLLRLRAPFGWKRRRLELPDGDFVDLDVLDPKARASAEESTTPVVVLLHGLEGSSRSGYMGTTAAELASRGLRTVALNFRSCGGNPNRMLRSYHSGETGDLRTVLSNVATTYPGAQIGMIGFSLGGNVLLKYLGESGSSVHPGVARAAAVSVPFDLAAGATCLEQGFGRVYGWRFLRSLKNRAREKAVRFPEALDLAGAESATTIREFDDRVTAPVHGFSGAEEYYRTCSSMRFVSEIRTPTLVLHATDDPFLPSSAIPFSAIAANPYLEPGFTATGGHLGFVGQRSTATRALWPEREAARYMSEGLIVNQEIQDR